MKPLARYATGAFRPRNWRCEWCDADWYGSTNEIRALGWKVYVENKAHIAACPACVTTADRSIRFPAESSSQPPPAANGFLVAISPPAGVSFERYAAVAAAERLDLLMDDLRSSMRQDGAP